MCVDDLVHLFAIWHHLEDAAQEAEIVGLLVYYALDQGILHDLFCKVLKDRHDILYKLHVLLG